MGAPRNLFYDANTLMADDTMRIIVVHYTIKRWEYTWCKGTSARTSNFSQSDAGHIDQKLRRIQETLWP